MVKKITSVNVDEEILEQARKKSINISEAAERGIRERLGNIDVEISVPEVLKCRDCGKIGEKETAENVNKDKNALTWLYPDEVWICNRCLLARGRKIALGHVVKK